jgi:cytochrome P450
MLTPCPPDDYMNGMLIPKGSTIVINAWGMHHDPETWAEPEKFNPERYAAWQRGWLSGEVSWSTLSPLRPSAT